MTSEAQQRVRELFNSKDSDPSLLYKFKLFDASVEQKLWSTRYCCNELKNLKIKIITIQPSAIDTKLDSSTQSETPQTDSTEYIQSTTNSTVTYPPLLDIEGYCLELNFLLDSFLMNSMSVLDTLAHLIWVSYHFPPKTSSSKNGAQDIYIGKIKGMLLKYHPNSGLGPFLDKKLEQDWFVEFEPLRNCTTHESLIASEISPVWDQINNCYKASKVILPDNPKEIPFTHDRNKEAITFCQQILDEIQSIVNEVYKSILIDSSNANSILPIPSESRSN